MRSVCKPHYVYISKSFNFFAFFTYDMLWRMIRGLSKSSLKTPTLVMSRGFAPIVTKVKACSWKWRSCFGGVHFWKHMIAFATLKKVFDPLMSGFKPHFPFLSLVKLVEAILKRFIELNHLVRFCDLDSSSPFDYL